MLAGLMLLKHAPPGQQTWQTFDHFDALGLDASEFGSLHFPTHGTMHKVGLSVCGDAGIYNDTAIWTQDQSIMSWTGGYCIASAHNMAKFLFKLVVPGHMSIVSPKSVAIMQNVSQMNRDSPMYHYGLGLMHGRLVRSHWGEPNRDPQGLSNYSGHLGTTYGFLSRTCYFPALNATIATIVNVDGVAHGSLSHVPDVVMCQAVEAVAKHKGLGTWDFGCEKQ